MRRQAFEIFCYGGAALIEAPPSPPSAAPYAARAAPTCARRLFTSYADYATTLLIYAAAAYASPAVLRVICRLLMPLAFPIVTPDCDVTAILLLLRHR